MTSFHHCLAAGGLAALASCSMGGAAREFEVQNDFQLQVPEGADSLQAWFALPADQDELQRVERLHYEVAAPPEARASFQEVRDAAGNRFLYLTAQQAGGASLAVRTSFTLERREARADVDSASTRPLRPEERAELAAYLEPDEHVVIDAEIRKIAAEVAGAASNPIVQARQIYDWVLDHASYWVKQPESMKASPVGSSAYCLEQACGNCTDFHSLYASLSRAAGLPTRMVYGSFLKGPLDAKDQDQSYHCWIEFWAPEVGWIPLDVAVADVFVDDFQLDDRNRELVSLTTADGYHGPDPALVDWYFGNLDARRVSWNVGRDLLLPPTGAGPVNALPKAYVLADGQPLAEKSGWTRKMTFRETTR